MRVYYDNLNFKEHIFMVFVTEKTILKSIFSGWDFGFSFFDNLGQKGTPSSHPQLSTVVWHPSTHLG